MEPAAMFDLLYRDELASLREAGAALAQHQPQLAAMLAAPSDDPDVERLVQGFAFVAARLRQRVEAAAPELVEALLSMVLPSALRPLPAATIVAFRRAPPRRGVLRIPRGAQLAAREIDGTRCTFTTTRALLLPPLDLTGITLANGASHAPTLTLRFASDADAPWATAEAPVRLFLHGDEALTEQLGLWLTRHLASVRVRAATGDDTVIGGAEAVQQVDLDADDPLLPWPAFAPAGTRLLEEWFALPEKHRFFDLHGLVHAGARTRGAFEVVLQFDRPPPIHARLPDDLVRLHCVPAVNLFDVDAEPLRVAIGERPHLLRAAGIDPAHMEVFDVRTVTGLRAAGARVRYPDASALGAAHGAAGRYAVSRRQSPVDSGFHTYLTLHRALDHARAAPDETLSIALTCSNRELPRALSVGDVATATASTPAGVSFTNVTLVTAPRRPPLGSARMWHFAAWLACARRDLADAETLRAWLALHAGRGTPVDDLRIAAIQSVSVAPVVRAFRGVAVRGAHYRVALDRAGFVSEGAAHALGQVLHRMLSRDARLNEFADLTVALSSGLQLAYRGEPGG